MTEDIARIVRESRAKQGLPPTVVDEGVLAKVAALITSRSSDAVSRKRREASRRRVRDDGAMKAAGVDPQAPDWEGHAWSEWTPLDTAIKPRAALAPNDPGLYRFRCSGQPALIYIGETGRSIRGRMRHLRAATRYVAALKPPGPPHVAGGCILWHERQGFAVEISWVALPDVDGRERKGLEAELIAAHRKAVSANPACQFAGEPGAESPD